MLTDLCPESAETRISDRLTLIPADKGLIYRNPKPHVRSIHAYFPSVVAFSDSHLGASAVLGEAFEAPNCHVVYFESLDGGANWEFKSHITHASTDYSVSTFGRITRLPDNRLLAIVSRYQRHPNDNGLAESEGLAMRPMTLETHYSDDYGQTWRGPFAAEMPFQDTAFEMCSACHVQPDGVLFWPTSTWPDTTRKSKHGFKTIAVTSPDFGRSWTEVNRLFNDDNNIYWESKIVALPDKRLLAVAWVHNLADKKDLPNHFSVGSPDGRNWSMPRSMHLIGQTTTPVVLKNGDIVNFYRRTDRPGLWVVRSRLDNDEWTNVEEKCIWTGTGGTPSEATDIRNEFATLRFGAPTVVQLPNGDIFMAFWCVEDCVSNIRYFRFSSRSVQ